MKHTAIILFFFLLSRPDAIAQNRVEGFYSSGAKYFYCADTGVIVQQFVGNRAAFMIKGRNPFKYKTNGVGFIDTTGLIVIKPDYIDCSNFRDGFAVVRDTASRQALIDTSGKAITPFATQSVVFCSNGLFIRSTFIDGKKGFSLIDARGNTIVPFGKYTDYGRFRNLPPLYYGEGNDVGSNSFYWYTKQPDMLPFTNYIGVKAGEKWGAIDRYGKQIIAPKYDGLGLFVYGIAQIWSGKKIGLIDTAGNELVPPVYDNIVPVTNKLAIAILNRKYGLVSTKNKTIIPVKYDLVEETGNGFFRVMTGDRYNQSEYKLKYGIMDARGKIIFDVNKNYIPAFGPAFLVNLNDDSTAVFDRTGKRLSPYGLGHRLRYPVWDMGYGLGCMVYNSRKNTYTYYAEMKEMMYKVADKWGLIDSTGREVIKPVFDRFQYMWLNRYIAVHQNNKWSFINPAGKKLLADDFDEITNRDYFVDVRRNGKYGLIAADCRLVLPADYDKIEVVRNGVYTLVLTTTNKKCGAVDETGRQVITAKYDDLQNFLPGLLLATTDKKSGLVDLSGRTVAPCVYDGLSADHYHSVIMVVQNGLYGLMDMKGKLLQSAVYKSLTFGWLNGKAVYIANRDGKTGTIGLDGTVLVPFK